MEKDGKGKNNGRKALEKQRNLVTYALLIQIAPRINCELCTHVYARYTNKLAPKKETLQDFKTNKAFHAWINTQSYNRSNNGAK